VCVCVCVRAPSGVQMQDLLPISCCTDKLHINNHCLHKIECVFIVINCALTITQYMHSLEVAKATLTTHAIQERMIVFQSRSATG